MTRPPPSPSGDQTETEKYDAWYSQRGLRRTEAKRKYIATLIDTMKMHASKTREAKELVGELEFIWEQVKGSDAGDGERDSGLGKLLPAPEGEESADSVRSGVQGSSEEEVWRERVEKALAKMSTEVAALREQLEARRGKVRRERLQRVLAMVPWAAWAIVRHLVIEAVFWGLVVLWMRKRGDKRAEEALRLVGRFVKEGLRELGWSRRKVGPSS